MKCDELKAYTYDDMLDGNADVDIEYYPKSEVGAAIEELKAENRGLKRALWLARAEWARSSSLSYHLIESHPNKDVAATYKRKANKWEKVKDKCLKKAEEYK